MPGLCLHINYYVLFIICLVTVIQLHKQNFHFDFQNTLPFFVHVFFLYNFVFFSRWIKANSTVLHKYHVYCVQFSFICLQSTTVEYVNYVCICYWPFESSTSKFDNFISSSFSSVWSVKFNYTGTLIVSRCLCVFVYVCIKEIQYMIFVLV